METDATYHYFMAVIEARSVPQLPPFVGLKSKNEQAAKRVLQQNFFALKLCSNVQEKNTNQKMMLKATGHRTYPEPVKVDTVGSSQCESK
ncbi:hypothetical protein [Rhizobium sp. Rhizsp42]|uniref:hypothetical protein n=1 Tax=Rhizobium sp. Rhizsp42 TaxID=3243034 RepID=UPI0039AF4CBB